jgi:hypothetical protein
MKKYLRLFLPLVMVAPAVVAQEVNTDYDRSADFSRYHTFAWKTPRIGNGLAGDEFLERRLENAFTTQLMKKGLEPARGERPDVYLVYRANAQVRQQVSSYPSFGYRGYGYGWRRYGWGPGWGWGGPWERDVIVSNYLQGSYVIDMVDARTNRLVWRAYAENTGSKVTDLTKEKSIEKIAEKAMKKFPPAARG